MLPIMVLTENKLSTTMIWIITTLVSNIMCEIILAKKHGKIAMLNHIRAHMTIQILYFTFWSTTDVPMYTWYLQCFQYYYTIFWVVMNAGICTGWVVVED